MASELEIAQRAVERGLLSQERLTGCLAERRQLLQDGLDLSLRDLLFDQGLLDAAAWAGLVGPPPPPETRAEPPGVAEEEEAESVVLGDYRVLREIGRGAMGVVYEAVQETLGRRVALKVLPATQALQGIARERFLREAQATASLRHPGIVPIYDIAAERGVHFFAMELLEGQSLRARLEQGPLPVELAARVARAAAEALAYAHARGVIHRDVKPDNIILRDDGQPVLTDFGLALRDDELGLTRAGTIVGTPLYMAPEQTRGSKELDGRIDVYALAVTLYELLSGEPPFRDAPDTAVLTDWIQHREPPALRRRAPQVPPALAAIVEQGMAKERDRRYADAGALAADLGRFLAGEAVHARALSRLERARSWLRRRRRLVGAAAVALVLAAGGWVALAALGRRWEAEGLVLEALHQGDRGLLADAIATLDRALELAPSLAEAHTQRALLLLEQGERDAGLAGLDDALRVDPRHVGALLARAHLRRELGRLDDARADFTAATAADPDDPRPRLGLGVLLARDDPRAGLQVLRAGLELARQTRTTRDPLYVEAVPLTGALLLDQGQPDQALAELEEAVRLSPELAEPQVLLGRALHGQGQSSAAVEAFSAALRRDPQQLEARELRGLAYRTLGRYAEAFADLQVAAAGRPSARLALGLLAFETQTGAEGFDDDAAQRDLLAASRDERLTARLRAQACIALGWLELHASRPYRSKALARFDEALGHAPRSAGARLGRALVLLRWDRLDEAEAELKQAQVLPGGAYAAQVGLARLAALRGEREQALALLDALIAREPERATAYGDRFRLRDALSLPGADADRAQALALRAAARVAPFDETVDPFQLAEQASALGFATLEGAAKTTGWRNWGVELGHATAWLERAQVYDPLSPTAAAWRATALYLHGRFGLAVKAYARARELDPGLTQADLLVVVLRRDVLRDLDQGQALAALEALTDQPMEPNVRAAWCLERARCLIELGRPADALPSLDAAEAAQPGRWIVASLRARVLAELGAPDAEAAIRAAAHAFFDGQRDPARAQLFVRAGDALQSRDREQGALHLLTRAIEADPLYTEAWRQRSRIRLRGSPEELAYGFVDAFVAAELAPVEETDRFLELEARIRRFVMLLGGLDVGAREAIARMPELPAASFCHGFLSFYQARYAEAEALFDRAHELSQGRSYLSLCYRGVARMRQGRHAEAEADFDEAARAYPAGPVVEFWRACLAAERGEDQRCLAMLERIVAAGWLVSSHLTDTPELQRLSGHERIRRLLATLATD